jgi:nicotinamide riboside transporter PnuC|tara:strand:- start:628 stop:831 length:204 start_codon:yes stop_codon:yes gene_type:complete
MKNYQVIYNLPVPLIEQEPQPSLFWQAIKFVGGLILAAIVMVEIWGLFWVLCALDDVCYVANGGVLN